MELKPFWADKNWVLIDGYKDLSFPFDMIETPELKLSVEWNLDQVLGHIESWSAYQKYIDDKKSDPVDIIKGDLLDAWGEPSTVRTISWDLHWLAGKA